MVTDAIILAGGKGVRLIDGDFSNSNKNIKTIPKQFLMLGAYPVFIHSLKAFLDRKIFRQIVVVAPKEHLTLCQDQIDAYIFQDNQQKPYKSIIRVIPGGDSRQESSYFGLRALAELTPLPVRTLIHDACRPYLSQVFMDKVVAHLSDRSYAAWVPAVTPTETIKRVSHHQVVETLIKEEIRLIQTPQIFEYPVIYEMSEKAYSISIQQDNLGHNGSYEAMQGEGVGKALIFTDDACLCEHYGIPVGIFDGDRKNIKLTYDYEYTILQTLLNEPIASFSQASDFSYEKSEPLSPYPLKKPQEDYPSV